METSTIKKAIVEIVTSDSIAKDNLMSEMNEAILGAMGTFVAIAKGILTTESNPVTGEPLTQIAKEQAEELRKIFDKYIEMTNNMANETLTFRPSKKNETILAQLSELAEKENRSLNNYIETLFITHLKERGQKIIMHKDEIKNVSPHGSNTMLAAAAGNLKFDVRIGNWVAFKKKNKSGYDCTTITQSCFEGNYIEKAFNPEPLSFQWLENFGFEKSLLDENNPDEGFYYSLRLSDDKYCDLSILSGGKNGYVEACLFPYEESFRVKYVHQLQNLFHAITGKELRHIKSGSICH